MALEDILGTRPAGRGYTPTKSEPAKFRPITRFEKSDPSMRSLYEKQRAEFNARKKEEDEEYATYSKAMQARYGKDWARKVTEETAGKQRAESKESAKKAAADMRSGKTSGLVGKARDPYAGVGGEMATFKTQEEADRSGLTRYKLDEPQTFSQAQQMPGPVEVRKAIPQQRVYKAMVMGERDLDKTFATKEEAESYLAQTGKKGAVASVRGTPQEMEQYKEQATSEKREKGRLADVYKQRQEEAKSRTAKMREAAEDYDKATTPAEKDAARRKGEATQLDISTAQATRGMPEDQKKKFTKGMEGVLERRNAREAEVARKTAIARTQRQKQLDEQDIKKSGQDLEKQYDRIMAPLYRASRDARRKGNPAIQYEIENLIAENEAGVPRDPKQRRAYFESGAGEEWKNRLIRRAEVLAEYEARERSKSNTNPTINR